jgi:hypothetical protein
MPVGGATLPAVKIEGGRSKPKVLPASGAAKAKAKGRGRPKRDPATLLRSGLRELAEAGPGSKFFTDDWKNVHRNWSNYLVDMQNMIELEDDESALADLQLLDKQVQVARAVCHKFSTSGMSCSESLECYQSRMIFLNAEPAAPSPFPLYVSKMMFSQTVEDAWPASKFWNMLNDRDVETFVESRDKISEFQMTSIVSKLMLMCQKFKSDELVRKLEELCSEFVAHATDGRVSCTRIASEIKALSVIVLHDSVHRKEVNLNALSSTLDDLLKTKVWEALCAFPEGRAIYDKSKGTRPSGALGSLKN